MMTSAHTEKGEPMLGEEVIAVYGDAGDGEELFEVQKLVRCKECKYGSDNKVYGCSLINFNTDEWHRMYADDFCSRGERKEGE